MTLHKSLPKKRSGSRSYFAFLIRHNWPVLITNLVLLGLLNIVPLYMFVGDEDILTLSQIHLLSNMLEFAQILRAVNIIAGSILAVVWGCGCMSYLNSKTNVHFYHSIPLTRSRQYAYESLVKVVCYLIPMALVTLFSVVIMGIRVQWDGGVVLTQLGGFLCAAVYFVLYFCIMVFAASYTGTAFSRILNAGLIVFLPSAIIACMVVIWSHSAVYSVHDWAITTAGEILWPVRTVYVAVGEYAPVVRELLLAAVAGIILWVLGGLIYRFRKSELSGTPVISKVAAAVLKYSCMFCASVVGGMVFEAIAHGEGWFICGALTGALLSLMLINTILTKSAKQMFCGLPGFGVFCAAFVAVFVLFGADVVGMDRYVPMSPAVKYITVSTDEVNFHVEDREDIARLTDAVRAYMKENPTQETSGDKLLLSERADKFRDEKGEALTYSETQALQAVDSVSYQRYSVSVRFVTHIGFIYEKRIPIYPASTGEEGVELLTAIADSKGFADAYFGRTPVNAEVSVTLEDKLSKKELGTWKETGYPERLASMRGEFNGMAYFQRGTFLTMHCRGQSEKIWYATHAYPVYSPTESEWRTLLNSISFVYVVDNETGVMTKYEDEASIRAICEATSFLRWSTSFTLLDARYSVSVFYEDGVCAQNSGAFVRGLVPDFIP